jgi:hypothetical protein
MASRDLTMVLNERYPNDTGTKEYLDQLHVLSESLRRPSLSPASTH